MSKEFGQHEGFIVSSDCVGRFGNPTETNKVWDFALREETFLGVEVIAWKNVVRNLNKLIEGRLQIAGLHGRMGRHKKESLRAKFRSSLLDSSLVGADELLNKAPQVSYVLMHSAYLDDPEIKEKVVENASTIRTILVENHVQKGAMEDALKHAISLREKGVNAGIMLDIVHYFYENKIKSEDISIYWQNMVFTVNKIIEEAKIADPKMPIGIHIPVGTRKADSLFMDGLTPKQWQKLADVIHDLPNIPVILENQQEGIGLYFLTPEDALTQKYKNEKNFETLVKNGIILL